MQALFEGIDLTGMVVTGDAAHAQHATAAHLTCERGGDYALTVKGNQPTCSRGSARRSRQPQPALNTSSNTTAARGKIVRRSIWIAPATGVEFPGAAQVFRIRQDTFDHRGNHLSKEIVHDVTSLTAEQAAAADVIARFIRQHCVIENRVHWVRDVVYREDHQHAYAGSGAHTMVILCDLALGLLRLAGITDITSTLQRIAGNRNRILPIMATITPQRL